MASQIPDARLANVEIGRMIKCRDCGVNAFAARYSNKQLNEYRQELLNARRGKPVTLPRCINCTPGNVAELKCQDCREVKPSEDFSRSARRQPDKARCRTCVQASEDLVPDLDEALAEEQIREEYEKSAHESSISGMSSHGSTLAYSSTGYAVSDSGSQISSQHGVYIIDGHDSAWDVPRQPPSASPSNAAQSARASGAGSTATSYNRGPSAGGRGGFSNISAYRPSVEDRVREQVARQQQQGERTQGNQQARGTAGRMRDDSDDEEDSDFEL